MPAPIGRVLEKVSARACATPCPRRPTRPFSSPNTAFLIPQSHHSLCRFHFAPVISKEDFHHWMMPREGVVYSFVVEDPETKKATDMVSFYSLPSTVVQSESPTILNVRPSGWAGVWTLWCWTLLTLLSTHGLSASTGCLPLLLCGDKDAAEYAHARCPHCSARRELLLHCRGCASGGSAWCSVVAAVK